MEVVSPSTTIEIVYILETRSLTFSTSASHEANESSQHIITDPPLKNVPDQGSALYQDLGNYFRWLQENGNIITDIAIIGRARSLIRTDQDARTVEALSSLDGLETFARWHNLSVRQMAYQPPEPQPTLDSTLIEPPALHDLVDKAPRAAPLRAEEWDGSRFASDERNHSQVGGFSSSVRDAPFTDSGYASVPNPSFPPEGEVSKSVPLTGTADDDSKTVYSVATAAVPSLAHKSILEVCKDIHTKIIRQMVNVDWASVSHTIPTLIKAFAVKLGSDTSSDNDRRIMHFVHQHHQYVLSNTETARTGVLTVPCKTDKYTIS